MRRIVCHERSEAGHAAPYTPITPAIAAAIHESVAREPAVLSEADLDECPGRCINCRCEGLHETAVRLQAENTMLREQYAELVATVQADAVDRRELMEWRKNGCNLVMEELVRLRDITAASAAISQESAAADAATISQLRAENTQLRVDTIEERRRHAVRVADLQREKDWLRQSYNTLVAVCEKRIPNPTPRAPVVDVWVPCTITPTPTATSSLSSEPYEEEEPFYTISSSDSDSQEKRVAP